MKGIKWIADRLQEASTWRGLTMLLTAVGISIKPDLMEQIIIAGTGIAGLIGLLAADK